MHTKMDQPVRIKPKQILDALDTYIAWKDTEGRYLGANQHMLSRLGVTEAELIGKTSFDFFSQEEAQSITENDRQVFQSLKTVTFHEVIRDRQGIPKTYFFHKSPLFDDAGKLIGIVAIASDVTLLDQKENQLKQMLVSKDSYIDSMGYFNDIANIFNNMAAMLPANIYWKDMNGVYLGCNETMLKFTGVGTVEELIGKTIFDLVDKDSAMRVHETDQRIMREGKSLALEEEGLDNEGNLATFISHKVPVRNDAGEVIGLLGVSFDITQRRRMMDALVSAKDQAESASRAKSDFIMNMSHDIRTPFVGILGFAELLAEIEQDPAKQEMIGYIRESSERLLGLLNEVIDIVHEDSGQKIQHVAINIRELVEDLRKMMLARIKLEHLSFNTHISEDVPEIIYSDKHGLNRILLNLIGNAVKFTEKGAVSLGISVLNKHAEGFMLRISVSDTGIGIPENMRQEIFERFTRLSHSWSGKARGSGLGLYFVKSIVDRLGGNITLKSEEGVGSDFIIDVPCRVA